MSNIELDKLVIDSIADLDATAAHIQNVEERVWKSMAEVVQEWGVKARWPVTVDLESDFTVRPPSWPGDDNKRAWFVFGWGPDEVDNGGTVDPNFDLTRFCGVAGGRLCLWLEVKTPRRTWTPIARRAAADVPGFHLSDSANFYYDCTPGLAALSAAAEVGEFREALEPVRRSLEAAKTAAPLFTTMLREAKEL